MTQLFHLRRSPIKGLSKLLLFIFAISTWIQVSAQSDSVKVTLQATNTSLQQLFGEIEQQTHLHFYYQLDWIENKSSSISCQDMPLSSVLMNILRPHDLEYRIINGNLLVVLPENEVKMVMMQLAINQGKELEAGTVVVGSIKQAGKKPTAILKGKVFAGNTGESIVGATIQVENTNHATVTDYNGNYSFNLKPGIYKLNINSVSYEPASYSVKLLSDGECNFEVFEQVHKLGEVNIYADRNDKNVTRNQMSLIELDYRNIKLMTGVTGEKDIIKVLTRMPGVQSVGEFGAGINVRGGGEDQNLYLLDEAPIFNTAHVFGLLSVVNPDAVKSATLYKGHIPADFGERVSSVMDIKVAQNHLKKPNVTGGIGLFSSRLMVKTPIIKDKLSMQVGGRTSYSDWLLQRMPDYNLRNSSANFYDFNGSLAADLKKDKISLSFYTSHDYFKYGNDFTYNYGNLLGSLIWTRQLSNNLSGKLTLAASNYQSDKDETSLSYEQSRFNSGITYFKAKTDFTLATFNKHTIRFGAQAMKYQINPGKLMPLNDSSLVESQSLDKEKGFETALYISDQVDINSRLSFNAGLRMSSFFNLGPRTVSVYETDAAMAEETAIGTKTYGNNQIVASSLALEPRLSLKYTLTNQSSVKISYNRNVQNLFLIGTSSIPTPDNIWKLSDNFFKPIVANQIAAGYYHNIFNNLIEVSAELYYKKLNNAPDYRDNAEVKMNSNLERELTPTSGTNYGLELYIKKNSGKLDGSIGYTYSRSLRQTHSPFQDEMINGNREYTSAYDKPHNLNIEGLYHINRRLRFAANFSLSSGRAVTLPEYKYVAGRDIVVVYSDRNEYRLPTYHRLDLSVSFDESLRRKKKWKSSWTLSVMNVYARQNPYSVFYSKNEVGESSSGQIYALQQLYFIGKPLPTLTYNFIF